jgi:succinate dehydrogenase/fumarate reductase-like Fe-S protein
VASLKAMLYLGYRAIVAHPLKRLARRGTGLERFRAAYVDEGLAPVTPEDRAAALAAQECISCGLCETGCALAGADPMVRALGLHAAFRLYGRGPHELPLAAAALEACAGCAGCDALCPTGVPISRVVAQLRARAAAGVDASPADEAAPANPGIVSTA